MQNIDEFLKKITNSHLCPQCGKHRVNNKLRTVCYRCYRKNIQEYQHVGRAEYRKRLYNEEETLNALELSIITAMLGVNPQKRWSSGELSKETGINMALCRVLTKKLESKGLLSWVRRRTVLVSPNQWLEKYVDSLQTKGVLGKGWKEKWPLKTIKQLPV